MKDAGRNIGLRIGAVAASHAELLVTMRPGSVDCEGAEQYCLSPVYMVLNPACQENA